MSDGLIGVIFILLILAFVMLVASRLVVKLIWAIGKGFISKLVAISGRHK